MNSFFKILTLFFIYTVVFTQPTFYNYNFNPNIQYSPSYSLGFLNAGHSVHISTTVALSANSFSMTTLNIQLVTDTVVPVPVICTGGCTASTCLFSCDILVNNNYKVLISRTNTPNNDAGGSSTGLQPFQLMISTQTTLTVVPSQRTIRYKVT